MQEADVSKAIARWRNFSGGNDFWGTSGEMIKNTTGINAFSSY
jgi:hypothetical protein